LRGFLDAISHLRDTLRHGETRIDTGGRHSRRARPDRSCVPSAADPGLRHARGPPLRRNLHARVDGRPRPIPAPRSRGAGAVGCGRPTGVTGTALSLLGRRRVHDTAGQVSIVSHAPAACPPGSSGGLHGSPGPRPAATPVVHPELGDARQGLETCRGRPLATQCKHCFGRGGTSGRSRPCSRGRLPACLRALRDRGAGAAG
jgi:hypothetical protein